MHRLSAEGKGLIASDNLAQLKHLKLGDQVELPTLTAAVTLPIVGVVRDYSSQLGTLFIDRSVYLRYWCDDSVDFFRLYLKAGIRVDQVRQRILQEFAQHRRLFVLLSEEVRNHVLGLIDRWLRITYIQIAVAVFVAVLGIANALAISILDRRRELGVLRALGALNQQIRRTIWMEGLIIGFIGLIMGVSLGAVVQFYMLELLHKDFAGFSYDYVFPLTIVAVLVPTILISAFVSALGPAEAAVRYPLIEALEYE
jgi:putative ABC transport system permease protein